MLTSKRTSLSEHHHIDKQITGLPEPDLKSWQLLKEGDEAAFITIYKYYFEILFRYGSQFTQDQHIIQDGIQELFIDLRRNRQNLSSTTSIKKYLFKSFKNKIFYLLKKEKALKVRHQKADYFQLEISVEERLIDQQLTREKKEKLQRALEKISGRQREAIYYFYFENMSYQEIAEVMDLSHVKSARNLVYEALKLLKDHVIIYHPIVIIFFYIFKMLTKSDMYFF